MSKKSIPKALRNAVYLRTYGENFLATCKCCNKARITPFNYETAHIVAEANGGPTTLQNLVAICGGCNKSCSTRNLVEFKEMFNVNAPQVLISDEAILLAVARFEFLAQMMMKMLMHRYNAPQNAGWQQSTTRCSMNIDWNEGDP